MNTPEELRARLQSAVEERLRSLQFPAKCSSALWDFQYRVGLTVRAADDAVLFKNPDFLVDDLRKEGGIQSAVDLVLEVLTKDD